MDTHFSINLSEDEDEVSNANSTMPHPPLPLSNADAVAAASPPITIQVPSPLTPATPDASSRQHQQQPQQPPPSSSVYVAYPRPVVPVNGVSATPLMPSTVGRHNGFLRTYKVLLVGEAGVGKSNLMHRYCYNQYDPSLPSTIGAEFCSREVDIPSGPVGQTETVVLQLWDTAGQERNAGVISNAFYRNAVGAIVVYDVTRRESLLNVPRWVARVTELARDDCVCVVVGAKLDLLRATNGGPTSRQDLETLQQEADRISHAMGMRNFFTSALSGEGVLEAFTHLVLAVDAVQATPPERRTQDAGSHGGGGMAASRGSEMWTAASTVPASPIALFGHPHSRRSGDDVGQLSHFSGATPSPRPSPGMTPSTSGFMSPASTSSPHHASGPPRSPSTTPARQKKTLDLRGFGPGEDRNASPANAGTMGESSCGC